MALTDLAGTFQGFAEVGEFVKHGERYADALIVIAAAFYRGYLNEGRPSCWHCDEAMDEGCDQCCPGQMARVALGVA